MESSIQLPPALREEYENDIFTLYINGATRRQMLQYATKNSWSVSPAAIDAYIRKAKARAKAASKFKDDVELGKAILRYEDLYRAALTEKDIRAARLVVKDIVDLLGLAAPAKQEITHKVDDAKEFRELTKLIEEHLEKEPNSKAGIVAELKAKCNEETAS